MHSIPLKNQKHNFIFHDVHYTISRQERFKTTLKFVSFLNGEKISISVNSLVSISEQIENAIAQGVQPGDLVYFRNKQGEVSHAAAISIIQDGEIYYTGNSKRRFDTVTLEEGMDPDSYSSVEIIKINDVLPN